MSESTTEPVLDTPPLDTPPCVETERSRGLISGSAAAEWRERSCLLGVERSVCGRRWENRCADERRALAIGQQFGVPDLCARVMVGRGLALEGVEAFLSPSLKRDLPDPFLLKDMERATLRLAKAVMEGERIAIFTDYDVDGATSAAVLARFLADLGIEADLYVPDRLAEGYGPNGPALTKLKRAGADLVVCLDCGTTAFDALREAKDAGLDIIVIDHHTAEPRLPAVEALVNPNRLDDESGCGHLAAVGVTFLAVVALNRHLRQSGWYAAQGRGEPDLMGLLDLVALGTVCDVVPLTGLNRALVTRGLAVLARRGNPGLAALMDLGRIDERPSAFHLGFVLGPRINAGGRVGVSDAGARLLIGRNPAKIGDLARQLDRWNEERQGLEALVLKEAEALVEAGGVSPGLVMVAGQGWHPGVVGIVASRLQDRFQRPSLVIALDEEGGGRGSGRSVPGVDLGAAVIAARQSGLLAAGGGHPMAAGVTLPPGGLPAFREFMQERLDRDFARSGFQPSLGLDGVIQPGAARFELMEMLERLGPYGQGNPEPRFAVARTQVVAAEVVGQRHVRCFLAGADGSRLKAIAFRAVEAPLGEALLKTRGLPLHLAGKLRIDRWSGQARVQFIIEDAAPCG